MYAVLSLVLRVSLTRKLLRAMAPLRETAAATGGISPVLQALSATLAAPFTGSTLAARAGGALPMCSLLWMERDNSSHSLCLLMTPVTAGRYDTVRLGRDAQAERLSVLLPTSPVAAAPPPPDGSVLHRLWVVNAQLGTADAHGAAVGLCCWLDAALAHCGAADTPVAVVIAGQNLVGCVPIHDWGVTSCRTDVHAGAADLMVKPIAPGARVVARTSRDNGDIRAGDGAAAPPLGLAAVLECDAPVPP
jgi:hypothetical protein